MMMMMISTLLEQVCVTDKYLPIKNCNVVILNDTFVSIMTMTYSKGYMRYYKVKVFYQAQKVCNRDQAFVVVHVVQLQMAMHIFSL